MIETIQDGSGGGLLGLVAATMPTEEARPSWRQHPMRHLQKKLASGDTEEGAYPAKPQGMLDLPPPLKFAQTGPDHFGFTDTPSNAFGSLAPVLSAPAQPAVGPTEPVRIAEALKRGVTPARVASSPVERPLTLNIEGHKVTVGPSFAKLSPEDQDRTVDEIHADTAGADS